MINSKAVNDDNPLTMYRMHRIIISQILYSIDAYFIHYILGSE